MLTQFNFVNFSDFRSYCDQHMILSELSHDQLENIYLALHSFEPDVSAYPPSFTISDFQYTL